MIHNQGPQLSVKVQSLSAERAIIDRSVSRLERRMAKAAARGKQYRSANALPMAIHGKELKAEERAGLLALNFLRGRDYTQVERTVRDNNHPNLDAVERNVSRFGGPPPATKASGDVMERWASWRAAALAHLTEQRQAFRAAEAKRRDG